MSCCVNYWQIWRKLRYRECQLEAVRGCGVRVLLGCVGRGGCNVAQTRRKPGTNHFHPSKNGGLSIEGGKGSPTQSVSFGLCGLQVPAGFKGGCANQQRVWAVLSSTSAVFEAAERY